MSKKYIVQPNGLSSMSIEADSMRNTGESVELIKDDEVVFIASHANSKYIGLEHSYKIERKSFN